MAIFLKRLIRKLKMKFNEESAALPCFHLTQNLHQQFTECLGAGAGGHTPFQDTHILTSTGKSLIYFQR